MWLGLWKVRLCLCGSSHVPLAAVRLILPYAELGGWCYPVMLAENLWAGEIMRRTWHPGVTVRKIHLFEVYFLCCGGCSIHCQLLATRVHLREWLAPMGITLSWISWPVCGRKSQWRENGETKSHGIEEEPHAENSFQFSLAGFRFGLCLLLANCPLVGTRQTLSGGGPSWSPLSLPCLQLSTLHRRDIRASWQGFLCLGEVSWFTF